MFDASYTLSFEIYKATILRELFFGYITKGEKLKKKHFFFNEMEFFSTYNSNITRRIKTKRFYFF